MRTPGSSGRKAAWYFSRGVAASAPNVRPWNASLNATMACFSGPNMSRAHLRANLNAPSLASAPELQKKTRSAKLVSHSFCASRACGAV